LNDPEFAKSLKKTMENADSASYNLNKGMEALEYTWPFNKGFKRIVKAVGGNYFLLPNSLLKTQDRFTTWGAQLTFFLTNTF